MNRRKHIFGQELSIDDNMTSDSDENSCESSGSDSRGGRTKIKLKKKKGIYLCVRPDNGGEFLEMLYHF